MKILHSTVWRRKATGDSVGAGETVYEEQGDRKIGNCVPATAPGPPRSSITTTAAKRFSKLQELWRTVNSTARALLETQCYLTPRQTQNYS